MRPMRFWTLAAVAATAFFAAATPAAPADDGSVIDVLIAYTPEVVTDYAGSQANAVAAINTAIARVNTALTNSGVSFQLRVVGTPMIDFNGMAGDSHHIIMQLENPSDGVADQIHTLRNSTKADLVHMVLATNDLVACCGGGTIMTPDDVGPQFAPRAFSVLHYNGLNYVGAAYQMGHALGHNLGLQHAVPDPQHAGELPAYAYGHGYRDPQFRFRDIMAEDCPSAGPNATADYNCPRLQYYSNLTQTFNGAPMGNASEADAARALNNVRTIVANFRDSGASSPTPTPTPTTPAGGPPGKPTLVSPNGTVTTARPTYTWNAVAGAVDYQIWVGDAQTAIINTWHTAASACSGATCSITPATSLPNGTHTWWLLARNASGSSPWSNGMSFTVSSSSSTPTPTPPTSGPPTKPTLIGPSGTVGTATPTYRWNAVANATDYQLWVGDASTPVINTSHAASAVCSGTTCSVTPSTALANGGYSFWIQARNGAGSVWSDAMGFIVQAGAATATPTPPPTATPTPGPTPTPTPTPPPGGPPSKPTLVAPSGTVATSTPTYTWNAVSNATDYQLWVGDASTPIINTSHSASAVCSGATCSVTPSTALPNGTHSFWVQARNAAGNAWSNAMSFTVATGAPPGAATLVSPSGTVGTRTPTYTWNAVGGATRYQLWVGDASVPVIQTWYQASAVCSGSTCSVTPSTALPSGSHSWWIQTGNAAGNGAWSSGMSFVVP
jgi:hypothetical protein